MSDAPSAGGGGAVVVVSLRSDVLLKVVTLGVALGSSLIGVSLVLIVVVSCSAIIVVDVVEVVVVGVVLSVGVCDGVDVRLVDSDFLLVVVGDMLVRAESVLDVAAADDLVTTEVVVSVVGLVSINCVVSADSLVVVVADEEDAAVVVGTVVVVVSMGHVG